jgi:hypothetical protein
MEIKNPFIILISIILFVFVLLLTVKRNETNKNKNKIANTKIIKNTDAYKAIIKKYRFFLYFLYVIVFISIFASSILSSRIIEEQTRNDEVYNRDIMLCMDVSGSVLDLNAELVDTYKEVVKNLKGERFGISIFNTSSYLLIPLTDDYDYILNTLDDLKISIDINNDFSSHSNLESSEKLYYSEFITYGTLVGAEQRGSSLAGDGLGACVFDFPNLNEKRSRIIVFSTDNEVYGEEYLNVEEAAKISKSKNITVYSIAPKLIKTADESKLKRATELTGGNYYVHEKGPTVKNIVNEIEKKEKSVLKGPEKTLITDYPTIPFIITLLSFVILIIIDKVVLS